MITDTEIKFKGAQILATHLGDVEMERFIALIQREPFDYTKWHQNLDEVCKINCQKSKYIKLKSKGEKYENDEL